ncbi:hypothetical protein ACLOJK_002320 [Asimina triloba]
MVTSSLRLSAPPMRYARTTIENSEENSCNEESMIFCSAAMIHPKKLVKLARKSFSSNSAAGCSKSVADKGHFVVYTVDRRRFMVPLEYLHSFIFQQLLKMSEDVFGLPSDGPITLPCDGVFMEHVVLSVQRRVSEEEEKELLSYIAASQCAPSSCLSLQQPDQQRLLQSF